MSHDVTNVFVFDNSSFDIDELKVVIKAVVDELTEIENDDRNDFYGIISNLGDDALINQALSAPLAGIKGDVIVLGGVFNYFTHGNSSVFASKLAAKLNECPGQILYHTCHDSISERINIDIYDGALKTASFANY